MACHPSSGGTAVRHEDAASDVGTNAHSHVPFSENQRSRARSGRGWEAGASSFSLAMIFSPHVVQSVDSFTSAGGLGLLASTRLRSSIAFPSKR